MTELMRRAELTMAASPLAAEITAFFRRPDVVKKLVETAGTARPPVAAISRDLMVAIPNIAEDPGATRRIGLLVAAILEAEGFKPDRSGVRITDPLFVTASTYKAKAGGLDLATAATGSPGPKAKSEAIASEPDYLARSCEVMTKDEAGRAIAILKKRFPELFNRKA